LKENRKGRYRKEEQEVKGKERKGEGKGKVSQITYWKFNSKYLNYSFEGSLQNQSSTTKRYSGGIFSASTMSSVASLREIPSS